VLCCLEILCHLLLIVETLFARVLSSPKHVSIKLINTP
jgi:hypothetical protein